MNDHEQSIMGEDGRRVVFDAGSHLHLAEGRRPWLLGHVGAILTTVARPDYREDDPRPGRERFYRQHALDAGRWMRVVVDFNDVPGLDRHGPDSRRRPSAANPMNVTVAGTTFQHHHYDERGDVLYLSVDGYEGPPARALSTPEGHNVEYDAAGHVVAMTLTNVRWLLDRDGELAVTLPTGHVRPEDLALALRPAA